MQRLELEMLEHEELSRMALSASQRLQERLLAKASHQGPMQCTTDADGSGRERTNEGLLAPDRGLAGNRKVASDVGMGSSPEGEDAVS
jgi:hypothetical protein